MDGTSEREAVIEIAAAVVRDGAGRIALVRKRGTTAFMQPGGKLERDESPRGCLERELSEELGLSLADHPARALGVFTAPAANEPGHLVRAHLFLVERSGDLKPRAEIVELRWVGPDMAGALELAPLTREVVVPRFLAAPP